MIELHWRLSKARIWLDTLPDWSYEIDNVIEFPREVFVGNSTGMRYVAAELFLLRGPRALYGGLGAVFVPRQTHQLIVRVSTSTAAGQIFGESLVGTLDTARVGLPNEYVPGVLEGVMNAQESQVPGPGTLTFSCAVHSELGSSLWVFRVLSRILLRLIGLDKDTVSEEDILTFIRFELSS